MPARPPACVRSPGRAAEAAAGSAQVTSELPSLHDMIGLVLRKMAASVDRWVGGDRDRERGR